MEKLLLVTLVTFFMSQSCLAVQYIFHAPTYELVEVPGTDMTYRTIIMISRTDESSDERMMPREITISHTCPSDVQATADTADYSISDSDLTVNFATGVLEQAVVVTIKHDDVEEGIEFFCLTITEDQGSEYYTKIIIPENDFCYEVTANSDDGDYGIITGDVQYIGPWITSISDTIDFTVDPSGAAGQDINIFLATHAFIDDTDFAYYQLILDDSDGSTHESNEDNGDTLLFLGGTGGTFLDEFVPSTEDLLPNNGDPFSFWLRYEENSGTLSMGPSSDRNTVIGQYSHGQANALEVKHIFVSSAHSTEPVTYTVCLPASPKKITPVKAYAVGLDNDILTPIDGTPGGRGPVYTDNTCFLSGTVDDPWLQVDLGQVYDIRCVLIWKVADKDDLGVANNDINGAQVRVGSCPSDDIESNKLCYTVSTGDDASLADPLPNPDPDPIPIEGDCPVSTYGQYVYVFLETSNTDTDQFALCEVEVYGTPVSYGSETTVQFTQEEYVVNESDGTVQLDVYRTYPDQTATCTTAEYYTDSSVSPVSANSDDFVVLPNDPLTASDRQISWEDGVVSGDGDVVVRSFPITITNDNPGVCESNETFYVYLTNMVGGIAGDQSRARVKIIDEDSLSYSFAQSTFTASEGDGSEVIEVLRSGGTMQTGYAWLNFEDITATSADYDRSSIRVDFAATSDGNAHAESEPVEIEDDEIYEETESFQVSLGELSPNDECSTPGGLDTATVFLVDNDSRFRFNVGSDTSIVIPEGDSVEIEIVRDGVVQTKYLEIVINQVTADLGDDFTISPSASDDVSTVTFVEDDEDVTIVIDARDDVLLEGGSETFTLTLRDPLYPTGNRADPYTLTITITDNEAGYYWKQASYSVQERSGSVTVCLIRTRDIEARTVYVTTNSVSATPGVDYSPLTSITFLQSQNEACGQVQIIPDNDLETNEVFIITINSGQDIINDGQSTTTVTIIDDDNDVEWSQPAYAFAEGSSDNFVVISKDGTASVTVTVTVSSGTATQYSDFNLNIGTSTTITIPSGAQSYSIPVTIIDDNVDDDNEIFTLTLSAASNGVISQAQTTVTIVDNDEPPVQPDDEGLGVGAIVGIVAAALVGVIFIIIIIVAFCYLTSRRPVAVNANALPLGNLPPGYAGDKRIIYQGVVNGYGPGGLPNGGYDFYGGNNLQSFYGPRPGLYR